MNLALFDFDGPITMGDSWKPFLRLAVSPGRKALAHTALFPVGVGYYARLVSGSTARPVFAYVASRGVVDAAGVQLLGRQYAQHVLPGTVRSRALEQIEWHRQPGDDVVVVSGSLAAYVHPWCQANGVRRIATELEERNGRLTGRYLGGECTGAGKARRIAGQFDLGLYTQVYAYGDTSEDLEMLALAHRRYFRWQDASADAVTSSAQPELETSGATPRLSDLRLRRQSRVQQLSCSACPREGRYPAPASSLAAVHRRLRGGQRTVAGGCGPLFRRLVDALEHAGILVDAEDRSPASPDHQVTSSADQ